MESLSQYGKGGIKCQKGYVEEAALREALEETGLKGKVRYKFILHEMVYDKNNNILEDKYFHICEISNIQNTLIKKFEGGENNWVTEKILYTINPVYHNEIDIFEMYKDGFKGFYEKKYFIETF